MSEKNIYMILTNGFDPDVRVYKEAKYLVEKGFNVEILCWDRKCEYKEKSEEILDGIKIRRFHILSQPGTGMKQIFSYIKFIFNIRKYLNVKKNCYYLHCHDFDGMITGLLSKKNKKQKLIFDMHEIYKNYSYAKNKLFDIIFAYCLKKAEYIIYVNDEQINNLGEKIKNKLVYLPNYPEEKYYMPKEKSESEKIRVNYIGALRDYNSLKALADIQDSKLEIGLYGIGICYDRLKEECEKSSVKIYGKYNGIKESGKIYRNTDILYCAYNPDVKNWKNAYPVKLFEAIITLTPIIASNETIAGEFITKMGIGVTVEYGNKDSIINAINMIVNDYNKYVENLQKISKDYKWEKIINNLMQIYDGGHN